MRAIESTPYGNQQDLRAWSRSEQTVLCIESMTEYSRPRRKPRLRVHWTAFGPLTRWVEEMLTSELIVELLAVLMSVLVSARSWD